MFICYTNNSYKISISKCLKLLHIAACMRGVVSPNGYGEPLMIIILI